MATDQGKTSNLNGLQLVSDIENKVVPNVGHTTFRPPYTPVSHRQQLLEEKLENILKPQENHQCISWHEKNNASFC
jgi:sarcosine oxidase subunit alpha